MEKEPAQRITSLTHLQSRPVVDSRGREVGKLKDLVVLFGGMYPRVSKLSIARAGETDLLLSWEAVVEIAETPTGLAFVLDRPQEELTPTDLRGDEMALGRNILDKKIMDTHHRRVVRVNNVQLEWRDQGYHVVAVLAGIHSLLRRLLPEQFLLRTAASFGVEIPREVIPWEHVEPIETELTRARKQAVYTKLAQLHPADIADIMEELNPSERAAVLEALEPETAVEALTETEPEVQAGVIQMLETEKASDMLEMMEPDEAADILGDLPQAKARELLQEMEPSEAEDVAELLEHEEDTAGGLMTTEYVAFPPEATVVQTLEKLRAMANEVETIYYLYVTDPSDRVIGVASLRELMMARTEQRLDEIMTTQLITVKPEASLRVVAETLSKYNLTALPVIDTEGKIEGIVTVDDVLDDLIPMIWKRRAAKKYL
ncbi:MAG: magnesium transporter [candidate division NC10 bacterium]|nr:magnesium transporter [candidate division NC10 bacterium]